MKKYGKTYYLATLFFPRQIKQDIFLLYSFVREADNLVDAAQVDLAQAKIALQDMQDLYIQAMD
ncbi:MAG: squalene/phytoene synthase family protein [Candidatus Peribacteria bacterium]|nr:MAG: squalene/phytoene synthase family protein [Candidatus Peribacteria bacterium]